MVKRYRNSPCVIIWSIGNKEWQLQNAMADEGARIAATMVERCHELDPTRVVSAAVNGNNKQGVSDALDIIGFNYNLKFPDDFHEAHPTRPVFGSETASALSTRGEYTTDPLRNTVSAYDVNNPGWGEQAEEWWTFYGTRDWEAGGFAWTGFDYRGEPTPYGWPSISSQFGIIDTCGFPKDTFFYYKSWWGKDPVLHLFPHWNFEGRDGNEIPVWVHSNLDEVELLVNGKNVGRQKVSHLGHVEWKVRYEPGAIEARGYKDGKLALTGKRETTGPAVALRLAADRTEINADGEDLAIVKVEALDKEGRPVPTAYQLIGFQVTGAGALIGVGNVNPNCQESDKEPKRSLFNGLAQVIVQAGKESGSIQIEATNLTRHEDITPATLTITAKPFQQRPSVPEAKG
jgi:beta-galactosidase